MVREIPQTWGEFLVVYLPKYGYIHGLYFYVGFRDTLSKIIWHQEVLELRLIRKIERLLGLVHMLCHCRSEPNKNRGFEFLESRFKSIVLARKGR